MFWHNWLLTLVIFNSVMPVISFPKYNTTTLVAHAEMAPIISWHDSATRPGESYLLIDDCLVTIDMKKATKDLCYVQKQIVKQCQIPDALGEKCD